MAVGRAQVRELRLLAGGCCEYCLLGEDERSARFEIDHIIPIKHGGDDSTDNLCLACIMCNRFKGPNLAGLDPQTGTVTELFHPRKHEWKDNFVLNQNGALAGLTPAGRATIDVLRINTESRTTERKKLMQLERYPCQKP